MVAGVVLGDLPAAIVQHLRADPDIAALCGDRISIAMPEGPRAWPMPTYAILVRPAGGLPPARSDERRWGRIDVHFYGSGASPNVRRRTSRLLWRTAEPALCPPPNMGLSSGFIAAGLIIYQIAPERSEPISIPERGTDWDRCVMSYMCSHARYRVA